LSYLVGTDIGTLGTKSVLVDPEGKVLAHSFREYGVLTPQQGWAEQWPGVWAEAAHATIKEAVERSEVNPRNIAPSAASTGAAASPWTNSTSL